MCMYVVLLITLIYKKLFILKSYIANNVSLNSNSYDCRNIIDIYIIPREGCVKAYKLPMLRVIVLSLAIKHCNYMVHTTSYDI